MHYRSYSQTKNFQNESHNWSTPLRPTMSTRRNDREHPKNRDGKGQETITVNRKLGSSRPTERTTAVRKVQVRPSTNDRTVLSETKGRHKDLQLGQTGFQASPAIPSHRIPQQNAVSPQAKNKSSLVEQPESCKSFEIQISHVNPTLWVLPFLVLPFFGLQLK